MEPSDGEVLEDRRRVSTGAVLATLVACHVVLTLRVAAPDELLSPYTLSFTALFFCGPLAAWPWVRLGPLAPLVAGGLVAVYLWLLWTTRLGRAWAIVHVLALLAWFCLGRYAAAYWWALTP